MTAPLGSTDRPLLSFLDVVKRFGVGETEVRALTDIDLEVAAGELVTVMGPSGCGKSTLLHLAGGVEQPTAGRVVVDGVDLAGLSPAALAEVRRRKVGFVFQRLNLIPHLSALENVMLPLELDGAKRSDADGAAREALARVGIQGSFDRFPDELSGGQNQRVAIARAIVGPRRLVLADEPTGALDTAGAESIIDLLAGLAADGAGVVLVTHEPRFAGWADRVIRLRDGRIVDEVVAQAV